MSLFKQIYTDEGRPQKATGRESVKTGYSQYVQRCWASCEDPGKGDSYTKGCMGKFVTDLKIATLPGVFYFLIKFSPGQFLLTSKVYL